MRNPPCYPRGAPTCASCAMKPSALSSSVQPYVTCRPARRCHGKRAVCLAGVYNGSSTLHAPPPLAGYGTRCSARHRSQTLWHGGMARVVPAAASHLRWRPAAVRVREARERAAQATQRRQRGRTFGSKYSMLSNSFALLRGSKHQARSHSAAQRARTCTRTLPPQRAWPAATCCEVAAC